MLFHPQTVDATMFMEIEYKPMIERHFYFKRGKPKNRVYVEIYGILTPAEKV